MVACKDSVVQSESCTFLVDAGRRGCSCIVVESATRAEFSACTFGMMVSARELRALQLNDGGVGGVGAMDSTSISSVVVVAPPWGRGIFRGCVNTISGYMGSDENDDGAFAQPSPVPPWVGGGAVEMHVH